MPPSAPSPEPKGLTLPRSRLLLLALLLCGLAAGAGWFAWVRSARRDPTQERRVILRVSGGEGLGEAQRRGLELLLQDHLEVLGNLPVLVWQDPAPPAPGHALYLQVDGHRSQQDLGLRVAWSWGPRGPWTVALHAPGPPRALLDRVLEGLPLDLKAPPDDRLCPGPPAAFWDLAESLGLTDVRSETTRAEVLARGAAAAAPGCSEAHLNLGTHLYSQLQWDPRGHVGLEHTAMAAFRQALDRVPGHPRAARELAILQSDMGQAQEGLRTLADAMAHRTAVPRLYEALAYAARFSGLLGISRRAMETQHRLALGQTRQTAETTLLYLGDWPGFLETCQPQGGPVDAKAYFYQGYVALARRQRGEALKGFQASTRVREGWYGFEALARVMELGLEGREAEARQALVDLDQAREGLRISDGEFTFKQAEAWAFLGDHEQAITQLNRALQQGFCCAPWYEGSPFLGPVRAHARWPDLLLHVRERQTLREQEFPASRFGW